MKALIPSLISGVISGAIAFAVAFLAPFGAAPAASDEHAASDSHDEHAGEEGKHGEKSGHSSAGGHAKKVEKADHGGDGAVFVNLEPLVVTLGPNATSKYLKIGISFETSDGYKDQLIELQPRFRDVLNTYLRAVTEADLSDPSGMVRLRAQILRRMRLVTGDDAITDVLITDFVLT